MLFRAAFRGANYTAAILRRQGACGKLLRVAKLLRAAKLLSAAMSFRTK